MVKGGIGTGIGISLFVSADLWSRIRAGDGGKSPKICTQFGGEVQRPDLQGARDGGAASPLPAFVQEGDANPGRGPVGELAASILSGKESTCYL